MLSVLSRYGVPPILSRVRAHPLWPYWPLAVAYVACYAPTYAKLAVGPWDTAQEGHGPFILAAAVWLAYARLKGFAMAPAAPRAFAGGALLAAGLFFYVIGSSQNMLAVEVGSQIPVLMGLILILHGYRLLLRLWFVLLFMIFIVPVPGWIANAMTLPLKQIVSSLTADWLAALGYPVSQDGIVLYIGQYKLLIQDACAGLNSMFSLSAVGLFYIYLANHASKLHSAALALFILPASFGANLVRVLILLLLTYHFGEAAGQGFMHDFSGIVMFIAALLSIFLLDNMLLAGRRIAAAIGARLKGGAG